MKKKDIEKLSKKAKEIITSNYLKEMFKESSKLLELLQNRVDCLMLGCYEALEKVDQQIQVYMKTKEGMKDFVNLQLNGTITFYDKKWNKKLLLDGAELELDV